MPLKADELTDLKLDQKREVHLGGGGDLATVSGIEDVLQSAAIQAGEAVRPLIGEPVTGDTITRAETRLRQELNNDVQLERVTRVEIVEINQLQNELSIEIFVKNNNSFTVPVQVPDV